MQYYYLISGLPDISFDDIKSLYTVQSFKKELDELLSKQDIKIINSLFLKYDNDNLLLFLNNKDAVLDKKGTLSHKDFIDLVQSVKVEEDTEEKKSLNKNIPDYLKSFVIDYLTGIDALTSMFWEDQLSGLYYDYLSKSPNIFIQRWAEFNLNIYNILIALACRRKKEDPSLFIVGNNEIATMLCKSNARDFGITAEIFEHIENVKRIDEETNILEKEQKIDLLRWQWIENEIFFNYFTIERITAFLLKLQMLERWLSLNEERGKQIYADIVERLKKVELL